MRRNDGNHSRNKAAASWRWLVALAFLQVTCLTSSAQIAINTVTNKIYAANETLPYVYAIDGVTHELTKIDIVGILGAIVVNPETIQIYAEFLLDHAGKSTLAVIDGATNRVVKKVILPAGLYGQDLDETTNKLYIANYYRGRLIVFDAASLEGVAMRVGLNPASVRINPVTNKIYVGNYESNELTIIDGATSATARVQIAGISKFQSIAVNTTTNTIYIGSNAESKRITVVDGKTNQTKTIQTPGYAFDVAVNSVTDKVYVTNSYIGKVTVIDGATDRATTVNVGHFPSALAVNPVTNKIYVANGEPCWGVSVIDGKTEEVSRIDAGIELEGIVVNTATNQIYAYDPETLTIIDGATHKTTSIELPIRRGMQRDTAAATCRYSRPGWAAQRK